MARTEKKSQIKGLPAKLQLDFRDSLNGSYPISNKTVVPTGSIKYFDTNTIRFDRTGGIDFGTGLPTGSLFISTLKIPTSSLNGSGTLRSGIGDMWLAFSSSASMFEPYKDNQQYAADGKSQGNIFFASSSKETPNPLWSKMKIEIPCLGAGQSGLPLRYRLSGDDGISYLMRFFDFSTQTWRLRNDSDSSLSATTWVSQALSNPQTGLRPFFETKFVGFGAQSLNNAVNNNIDYIINSVRPFSQFGFPFASKYSIAPDNVLNGGMLLPMDNYITKPFLLEAVVFSFSGSYDAVDMVCPWDDGNLTSGFATNFFFVLCQHGKAPIKETVVYKGDNTSFPANVTGSITSSYQGYNMDLVTAIPMFTPGCTEEVWWPQTVNSNQDTTYWTQRFINNNPNINLIFPNSSSNPDDIELLRWSGQKVVSGVVCSPIEATSTDWRPGNIPLQMRSGTLAEVNRTYPTFGPLRNGTRNNLSTRDFKGPFNGNETSEYFDSIDSSFLKLPTKVWRPNPYLLLPGDRLLFGLQAAFAGHLWERQAVNGTTVTGSGLFAGSFDLEASPESKIVLYGSYLEDGTEVQEYTQVLTTNAIHEVIE